MRTLDAPFLELAFYFADLNDADAFAGVAHALLARGSRFLAAECWRGPGKRTQPFESIRDEIQNPLAVRAQGIEAALVDPDLRIMEISFDQVIGISKAPEKLEYVGVFSEAAARLDHHPIEILAEGHPWSGPHSPERGRKPGKKVYQVFRELLMALTPSYASIMVEAPLPCPTDLHLDPSNHAFIDFYISEQFIGSRNLAVIAGLYDGAYQERVADGRYISTYRYMNPDDVTLDRVKVSYIAREVGILVGQRRPVRA